VLTITLLGGIALFFTATQLKTMTLHKKIAMETANSKMEEFRTMACATIADADWADIEIGGLTLSGADGKGIKVENIDKGDYCEIILHIKWNEVSQIGREFDVNLVTYVAP